MNEVCRLGEARSGALESRAASNFDDGTQYSPAAMNGEATGLRERVRQAIEGPVGESQKLLGELKAASTDAKLSILISGWGRGLAAGLEELAIAVDELLESELRPSRKPTASTAPDKQPSESVPEEAQPEQPAPTTSADDDEEQLRQRAKESREQTANLRKESEQFREDRARSDELAP